MNNIKQLESCFWSTFLLTKNGTVLTCGDNNFTQLGIKLINNNTLNYFAQIPNLLNVKEIASGYRSTLFLLNDGTVMGCGDNNDGQLGLGYDNNNKLPQLLKNISNVKSVDAGYAHSVFLLNDDTVYACGSNRSGQLGLGDNNDRNNFVQIENVDNIKKIICGSLNTLFLLNDGTVKVCGNNNFGQLGLGNKDDILTPELIPNLTNVKDVSCNETVTAFLLNDGTVKICGKNNDGQLGLGDTNDRNTPTLIPNLTNVKQISCGSNHTGFLLNNGNVMVCGNNYRGQLGLNSRENKNIITLIPNLTNVLEIKFGNEQSFFLFDNYIQACGYNSDGILGIGDLVNEKVLIPQNIQVMYNVISFQDTLITPNLDDRSFNIKINYYKIKEDLKINILLKRPNGSEKILEIFHNKDGSNNLNSDEIVETKKYTDRICINRNITLPTEDNNLFALDLEFLCDNKIIDIYKSDMFTEFKKVNEPYKKAVNVYSSNCRNFIIYEDGTVKSCGDKLIGFETGRKNYTNIPNLSNVKQISCNKDYTLFLLQDGTVKVCGYISNKLELGFDRMQNIYTPKIIPNLSNVKQIDCGQIYAEPYFLFLLNDGTVKISGKNIAIADNSNNNIGTPVIIPTLNNIKQIAAKTNGFFALTTDDKILLIGRYFGIDTTSFILPKQIFNKSSNKKINKIITDDNALFILYEDATIELLYNDYNNLDINQIKIKDFSNNLGGSSSLAFITDDDKVFVHGHNSYGQLGLGISNNNDFFNSIIPNLKDVKQVSCGFYQTLFLLKNGIVKACGANTGDFRGESFPMYFHLGVNDANNIIYPSDVYMGSESYQLHNLEDKIKELEVKIKEKDDKIRELEEMQDKYEQEISDLEDQINNSSGSDGTKDKLILELNLKINEKDRTILDLNNTIKEKDFLISQKNIDIDNLKNEINRMKNEMADLLNQIEFLKSQINNSDGDKSQLIEKISMLEKELDSLNNDIVDRLQLIEDKLSKTTNKSTINENQIKEMKESIIKDIVSSIGEPRFGFAPLPIGKQALAVSRELLSDPNTGHLYIKNGNRLLSKTKDNENEIVKLKEYNSDTWISINIDNSNISTFSSSDISENADETITSTNNIFEFDKINIRYNSLSNYMVGVKITRGNVDNVEFKDEDDKLLECKLENSTDKEFLFSLDNEKIKNDKIKIYPIIRVSDNTTIESIVIYRTIKLPSLTDGDGMIFDGNVDKELIDKNTIVNNDGTFTLTNTNNIKIKIPKESIKDGKYSMILRCKNVTDEKIIIKTIFNGSLHETKMVEFGKIQNIDSGKTSYTRLNIPEINNNENYYEISLVDSQNRLNVKYIILSLLDIDIDNYYFKNETDKIISTTKDEITNNIKEKVETINKTITKLGNNYGVTVGTNVEYTVNIKDITTYGDDGLTICITPHIDCGNQPSLRVNNLAFLKIKNSEGELLSSGDLKLGIPIILVRVGSYFFIRARVGEDNSTTDPDPNIKPGEGEEIASDKVEVPNSSISADVLRIVNSEKIVYRINNDLYTWNLKRNKRKQVNTNLNSGKRNSTDSYAEKMKMWKDKYVYANKIYSLSFKELASFPIKRIPDHFDKDYDYETGDNFVNYSEKRSYNHLILDSGTSDNLYYIEYVPVEYKNDGMYREHNSGSHQGQSYSWTWHLERYQIDIYLVNDDLTLTKVYTIPKETYEFWNRTTVLAIKDNYFYILCYPFEGESERTASIIKFEMRINSLGIREFRQVRNFCSYPVRLYGTVTSSYEYEMSPSGIGSQYKDRFIGMEYDYNYSTNNHDTSDRRQEFVDIEKDNVVYEYYRNRRSGRHRKESERNFKIGGRIYPTNNNELFYVDYISYKYDNYDKPGLFGILNGTFVSNRDENYRKYGGYTSKYRFTIENVSELISAPNNYKYYLQYKIYRL